jgi:hypothetical protein
MNNIKLFISTTGILSPVVIADFGNRTFTHPTIDYEITQEYAFEELFNSRDVIDHLTAGNIIFRDPFGALITTKEGLYQASVKPVATRFVKTAGETIFSHRAVIVDNGLVYLFDPTNVLHYGRVVGISNNAVSAGSEVEITIEGQTLNGIVFIPNTVYYAGPSGVLTNIMPTSHSRQMVGFSIDNTSMIVRINRLVKLI